MKKIFSALLAAVALSSASVYITSCDDDNKTNWEKYATWREFNEKWMAEQVALKNSDGTPYYTTVVAPWDPEAFVLVHYFGERHPENLKPLYTSTVSVNYQLHLADSTKMDQGTNYTSTLNSSSLISGWSLAVMQLNVGDSAEFVIPYSQGYGVSGTSTIAPYSNLRFNIRLVDIDSYQIK